MNKCSARLLWSVSPDDLRGELERMGAIGPAAEDLEPVQVRVDGVEGGERIEAACRRCGVDLVVGHGAVILTGTVRGLRRLADELTSLADDGLGAVGRQLAGLLNARRAAQRPRWICRGRQIPTDQRTVVMGIVNVTPDSFSGDGLAGQVDAAVQRALAMAEAGADILDVGGESTRPGSDPVPVEEELRRVEPVIRELAAAVDVPISIDTQKPEVAERALDLGAAIVNDVYGLRAPGMIEVVADHGAGAVIMHMLGKPKTMQQAPRYDDFIREVCDFLAERIEAAMDGGVNFDAIAVDPGFGFGKTVEHNLEMLRRLREFHSLGRPVLIGTSRKSTIGAVVDKPVEGRLMGTAASCAAAIVNGAHIIRVHDVEDMIDVARMTDAILGRWQHDASR